MRTPHFQPSLRHATKCEYNRHSSLGRNDIESMFSRLDGGIMPDMTSETADGPSAWDRQLYQHLTSHIKIEREMLEEYKEIADKTNSRAFAYLVNLLIEDETRHHRIFAAIASSLEALALQGVADPIIPNLDFHRADLPSLRSGTKKLLDREEEDVVELKHLQRQLHDVKDTTLWGLLVDLMQRDTAKHIAILRFIQDHAD